MSLSNWWNNLGRGGVAIQPRAPEHIIVSEKNAIRIGKQVAASLQKEQQMLGLMAHWMEHTLEKTIQEILSNTTYHYTMIDAMYGTEHEWMLDLRLLEPFAKAMWEQGFAIGSPDPESEYCRMTLSLRTNEKSYAKTWEEWRKIYFGKERQRHLSYAPR
jgi:hypothetical protein